MSRMCAYRSLLAVDPSLTCSGWALFSVADGLVRSVGKIRCDPPGTPMAARLSRLHKSVEDLFTRLQLGNNDVLVCEAPTTMKDPLNALKVEQVRGIFECAGRSRGVCVPGRVNPRTVQYEVMGLKGKQLKRAAVKEAAVKTVSYLYATNLAELGLETTEHALKAHQDIVDAVLVGRVAVLRLHASVQAKGDIEAMFEAQQAQRRRTWRVKSCAV